MYCDHDCTSPSFRLVDENGKIDRSLVVESHPKVNNKDHGQLSKAMSNEEFWRLAHALILHSKNYSITWWP